MSRNGPDVRGKTIILVDDGLATGATMYAAAAALREQGPSRIVVAVPTTTPETYAAFRDAVDDIVCVHRKSGRKPPASRARRNAVLR